MKAHTSQFKENVKNFGRELDSKITYTINGITTELGNEQLNSVSPHYEGAILKSVMKQLDIDSNVEIPKDTILNYQLGVKIRSGRNLFNIANVKSNAGEVTNNGDSLTITVPSGVLAVTGETPNKLKDYCPACEEGKTYTLSATSTGTQKYLYLQTSNAMISWNFGTSKEITAELLDAQVYWCANGIGMTTPATISQIQIEEGTEATSYEEFGAYDYIDYGTYVVKDVEKQEDTNSYKITCYDKLLYSMTDYTNLNITYPITVRNYINTICGHLGLTFAQANEQFANYDKEITSEKYLAYNSETETYTSLNYKFRDVLDELAQVTGGTICINDDDELEIRYIKDVGEIANVSSNTALIETTDADELTTFEIEGKTTQENNPTPSSPSDIISVGYTNLFNKDNVTLNTTINASGQPAGNIGSVLSDFIKVTPNTSYYLSSVRGGAYVRNCGLYDINKNFIQISVVAGGENVSGSITTTNNTYYIRVVSGTNYYNNCQVIKGTQPHSYIPYGKYGIEITTNGTNYFDAGKIANTDIIVSDNGKTIKMPLVESGNGYASTGATLHQLAPNLKVGDTIYVRFMRSPSNDYNKFIYLQGSNTLVYATSTSSPRTITQADLDGQVALYGNRASSGETTQVTLTDFRFIKEQNATWEQFKGNRFLYTLNQPLRSIGDTKDLLYIKNGYLYVERKIGSVVLDTFTSKSGSTANNQFSTDVISNIVKPQYGTIVSNILSSHFISKAPNTIYANDTTGIGVNTNGTITCGLGLSSGINTLELANQWLSANHPRVQYILANSYIEELGAVETPTIYEGITYIETTDNNEPTMNISYVAEIDEIDEEFLKDVNVDFGEKFGAINTLVLSRSAGADNIYYPSTLPQNPIEIKISDNQIMNGNDRDQYMPQIYAMINGLEYYLNDFSSTGICYYDLCDRYKVKIGDTTYKCIMFNDEINVTQGLEEFVHTDMPEETNTEYSKADSTDRKINSAYIIADKANSRIDEVTRQLDETNSSLNEVITIQTATERKIDIISSNIDDNGNVTEVTTTTGFTFNAEGMEIADNQTSFKAQHKKDGTYYYDGTAIVGQYTKDGSKQKDLYLYGVYYYGMDEITDTPMFVAQLYQDNGNDVVGHFYNGGN